MFADIYRATREFLERLPHHKARGKLTARIGGALVRDGEFRISTAGFLNSPESNDSYEMIGSFPMLVDVSHEYRPNDDTDEDLLTATADVERIVVMLHRDQALNALCLIDFVDWQIKLSKSGDYYETRIAFRAMDQQLLTQDVL